MTGAPLVTVVVPCFNASATVRAAIASARAQTYRPIEIVCVDDGSRDDTLAILRSEERKDLRVIVCARNGGVAAARNRALAAAHGTFLAFLDADDIWAEDKLARQVPVIDANPAMTLIGCRAEVRQDGGTVAPVNGGRAPPRGKDAWRTMLHHSYLVPSMVVVRTDAARRVGGFNEAMRSAEEDQDFFIRIGLEGEAGFIEETLVTMHEQPGSLSARNRAREYETVLPMVLSHCRALSEQLSASEQRRIIGARLTAIGRGIYLNSPPMGARLILRAIASGDEPTTNLYYLLTASPWARKIKARIGRARAA